MFRVRDRLYLMYTPFPAASGLWIAQTYAIEKDIVVDVFARSMEYAGESEEFLCHILVDCEEIGVGGEDVEDDFVVFVEDSVYPVYGSKNDKGELVQIRIEVLTSLINVQA